MPSSSLTSLGSARQRSASRSARSFPSAMACPYLPRRDRTFSSCQRARWCAITTCSGSRTTRCPRGATSPPTRSWCCAGATRRPHGAHVVRAIGVQDRRRRAPGATPTSEQLYSSFWAPLPAARVRRGADPIARGRGAAAPSALLTRCMDAATAGRRDARASGWKSVHEAPGTLPEGHPELPWMRRQVALRAAGGGGRHGQLGRARAVLGRRERTAIAAAPRERGRADAAPAKRQRAQRGTRAAGPAGGDGQ